MGSLCKTTFKPTLYFGSLEKKTCSTCNEKTKDYYGMRISEEKFTSVKPYSSHFIVALLPL
jgi:hypothetical protein